MAANGLRQYGRARETGESILERRTGKTKKGAHIAAPRARKPAAKPAGKKRGVPKGIKILGGAVAVLAAAAFGFVYLYPNVFPGVTVGPIEVGNMDRAQAVSGRVATSVATAGLMLKSSTPKI